ncbi:MAG TPA: hypothetical protein VGC54_03275 [Planctomycetota bacterium]
MLRLPCCPLLFLLLAGTAQGRCLPPEVQDPKPPKSREQDELVQQYLELDARTEAGRPEQLAILARLDTLEPLRVSELKSWQKKLAKFHAKGRKLPTGSGRHWFWEDEERGLYIVGGETSRPKGLLLGMHGGGVGSGDAGSSAATMTRAAEALGWVAIFPEVLEKTERGWTDSGTEEFVLSLVDAALRTWKIDPDHVYFSGHSMGGYGTWTLGAHHADRVAALAPSAGAPTPVLNRKNEVVDLAKGVIPSLRNVPMVIYQSDDDPRVPPEPNRVAAKKLVEAAEKWGGFEHEYWEVTGRGHDLPPGGFEALLAKIAGYSRNPVPDKIVWQPALAWKRQFYWLYWETPVRNAIVEARLDRPNNAIRISGDSLDGLQVLLDSRIVDMDKEVSIFVNGERTCSAVPEPRLSTLVLTGHDGDPARMFVARLPVRQ